PRRSPAPPSRSMGGGRRFRAPPGGVFRGFSGWAVHRARAFRGIRPIMTRISGCYREKMPMTQEDGASPLRRPSIVVAGGGLAVLRALGCLWRRVLRPAEREAGKPAIGLAALVGHIILGDGTRCDICQ